jgi:hypothetical protein
MRRYHLLEAANLDSHPTTLAGFGKWLSAAFAAVNDWLEHPAGTEESDADFYAAVANHSSKLARRMGAGHLAAPHIERCGHATALDLLGRMLAWSESQKPSGAWTTHSIAKWMKVSPEKVRGWITRGELKATNVGNEIKPSYRIDPANFDSFLLLHSVIPAVPSGRRRRRSAAM